MVARHKPILISDVNLPAINPGVEVIGEAEYCAKDGIRVALDDYLF